MENNTNKKSNFQVHLDSVRHFAQTHHRWPRTLSKNTIGEDGPDKEELKLGAWWSRTKSQQKKFVSGESVPGMDEERSYKILSLIAEFGAFQRDGIWLSNWQTCKAKAEQDQALWSVNDPDVEHQKMLRWINQQFTFCRKFRKGRVAGGMTAERAQKVEEIMTILGKQLIPQRPFEEKDEE